MKTSTSGETGRPRATGFDSDRGVRFKGCVSSRGAAYLVLPFFVLAFLCAVRSTWGEDAAVSVNASVKAGAVNSLVLGQNVPVSVSGIWNSTSDNIAAAARNLVDPIWPTLLRFPGGGFSDVYFWEDGLSFRTETVAKPGDSTVMLTAPPNWISASKARFLDSAGGAYGDAFSFTNVNGCILTGVTGFQAAHQAEAKVRPDARKGQPEWFMNAYGINEHMKLAESLGAQVLLSVNFGTGLDAAGAVTTTASLDQRVKRAAAWVAYMNGDPGDARSLGTDPEGNDWKTVGYWASRRAEASHPAAWKVTYWEIGNELFWNSETGYTTAGQYAAGFLRFAAAMKAVDPTIKVGAVGMSVPTALGNADTVDPWNSTVLKAVKDTIDFLSVHPYYPSALSSQVSFKSDTWYKGVMAGAAQAVSHLTQIRKLIASLCPRSSQIGLVLSEYGIWPANSTDAADFSNLGAALNNADFLMEFARHREDLGLLSAAAWNLHGNLPTSIVRFNWSTGARLTRPQYFTFLLFSGHFKGQRVQTSVSCSTFSSPAFGNMSAMTSVPVLNVIANLTADNKLVLITLNRSLTKAVSAAIGIQGYKPAAKASAYVLTGASLASNNENVSTTVGVAQTVIQNAATSFTYSFPARSLVLLEFTPK